MRSLSRSLANRSIEKIATREIETLIKLQQGIQSVDHIATIRDWDDQDGVAIISQFVHGKTLFDLSDDRDGKGFKTKEAVDIVRQVLDALENIHNVEIEGEKFEILHRDLHPGNIMYDRVKRVYKIIDFGLSWPTDSQSSSTILRIEPRTVFAEPKLRRNGANPDVQTDLYSVGILLWWLVTGRLPLVFEGVSELPLGLREVVEKACVVDRDQGFRSVKEMRDAVIRWEQATSLRVGQVAEGSVHATRQQQEMRTIALEGRDYTIRVKSDDLSQLRVSVKYPKRDVSNDPQLSDSSADELIPAQQLSSKGSVWHHLMCVPSAGTYRIIVDHTESSNRAAAHGAVRYRLVVKKAWPSSVTKALNVIRSVARIWAMLLGAAIIIGVVAASGWSAKHLLFDDLVIKADDHAISQRNSAAATATAIAILSATQQANVAATTTAIAMRSATQQANMAATASAIAATYTAEQATITANANDLTISTEPKISNVQEKYTLNGNMNLPPGSNPPGRFHNPEAIAVAHDGTVYILDTGNGRIRVVGPSGVRTRVG